MHSTPSVSAKAESAHPADPPSSSSSSSAGPTAPALHSASRQQALLQAVLDDNRSAVSELLAAGGIEIDAIDPATRLTPLMLAAAGGKTNMVDLLLEKKASAQVRDSDGLRALDHAETGGQEELVRRLQDAGDFPGVETSPGSHNAITPWTTTTLTAVTTTPTTTVTSSVTTTSPSHPAQASCELAPASMPAPAPHDATADDTKLRRLEEQVVNGLLHLQGPQSDATIKALASLLAHPIARSAS